MGKLINPATNRPFAETAPTRSIVDLRYQILRHLNARYDAAQTTSQNELHWRMTDSLSPNAANSLDVRKRLRERSRYETQNNGYLKGISLTLAKDFVASGPKLQISDPRFNNEQRTIIEAQYETYTEKIKLRRKLWRMRFAKIQDGETFMFAMNNKKLRRGVRRDYRVFECDQVTSFPTNLIKIGKQADPEIDGIRFDRITGDPKEYHLLNEHPGETELVTLTNNPTEGRWISVDNVFHWYRQERGWLRGIPETTPTLPLWALLRRYTLAVVQNAEIAADFTVLLKSMQSPNVVPFNLSGTPGQPTQEDPEDWFDSFPIDRGLMTVLPSSYDLTQLDPKQPVTVYDAFVAALVQEATRPLCTPKNVALGDSGGYNMASGTLDRQMYRQSIDDERTDCNCEILYPLFENWWFEAVRIPGFFDDGIATTNPVSDVIRRFSSLREEPPKHTHRWDEVPEHTDPVKVATAIDILHKGNHISDTDVQELRFNRSVDEHYANLERQLEWRKKNLPDPNTLGPNGKPKATAGKLSEPPEDEDDKEEDE